MHPRPDCPVVASTLAGKAHIGIVSRDEWEVRCSDVFDRINSFATGTPTNVVNSDVLDHLREAP
jgi:hypothetical protein